VDPDILEAQGANSGQFAEVFLTRVLPILAGASERFEEGAFFLDVGCGVASIAIELCRRSPKLRCVGLEPAPVPLDIARKRTAASGFATRIELRSQKVEDMTDRDAFDVAWLPTVFLPEPALSRGIERVSDGLRPGGWVITVAMSTRGDELAATLGRLRNVMWGGDPLTADDLADKLRDHGFVEVQALALPGLAPRMVAGRKPDGAAAGAGAISGATER
jgi:precorrin-6B methylase 2